MLLKRAAFVETVRADRAPIVAPGAAPRGLARRALLRSSLRMVFSGLLAVADAPVLLVLLAAACVMRWVRRFGPPSAFAKARTSSRQQFLRKRAMELFTADKSVSSWLALYRRSFGEA